MKRLIFMLFFLALFLIGCQGIPTSPDIKDKVSKKELTAPINPPKTEIQVMTHK